MICDDRALELNALIDGELTRKDQQVLLAHVATCPACTKELAALVALRMRLAWLAPMEASPNFLAAKIERAMVPTFGIASVRRRWPIVGGIAAMAASAAILFMFIQPQPHRDELQSVADASQRESIAPTAIVLADTRRGGTAAWFARHHLAAPPTPDLRQAGYIFSGCRTDIIAGHRASILVYARDGQQLTLIAWPANGEPAHKPRSAIILGQKVQYWNNGTLELWATGAPPNDIERFTEKYRKAAVALQL